MPSRRSWGPVAPRKEKQRPSGLRKRGTRYYAVFRGPDGAQREESCRTGDLREAKAYLARRKREVAEGLAPGGEGALTVAVYADTVWWPWRSTRIRSAKDERRWLDRHIAPYPIGSMRIEAVRKRHVRVWLEALAASGLAARSVRNAHGVLVSILERALEGEAILTNPASRLRGALPKVGRSTEHAFTRVEVLTLLDHEGLDAQWRAFFAVCAYTGARGGEVAGRRWGDLEDREPLRALHVRTQWYDAPLKTADGEDDAARAVPVHPQLERVLASWRAQWAVEYGRLPTARDWIFPGTLDTSEPYKRRQVTHGIARALRVTELDVPKGAGLHSFRRAFISTARNADQPKDRIAEVTHRPKGDVHDNSYIRHAWVRLCEVVLAVDYQPDAVAEVVPMRLAAASNAGADAGVTSEHPAFAEEKRWVDRGLNPGHPPCKGGALPLSYPPANVRKRVRDATT